VQMEMKVNGEQDAVRKRDNTFGIQSLPRLKPPVIKPILIAQSKHLKRGLPPTQPFVNSHKPT